MLECERMWGYLPSGNEDTLDKLVKFVLKD